MAIDGAGGPASRRWLERSPPSLATPIWTRERCIARWRWPRFRGGGKASELAAGLKVELGDRVLLDGEDVTAAIREPAVSEAPPRAADPEVRRAVVDQQRQLLARGDWVAEGRDIGTVVAPGAEVKVFLTADPAERARRRAEELGTDARTVLAEQTIRDERDRTREHSPLEPAEGAEIIDTTGLTMPEVVARLAGLVRGH